MKQKIIMFTLVTVILFCAVLIGYQIPKQQVKMKQNQIWRFAGRTTYIKR